MALVGATLASLILADLVLAAATPAALAQPPRRSTRKSQPVPIARTAPDTTATIIPAGKAPSNTPGEAAGAPAKPSPVATRHYGEELAKPFDLPVAPRARMRSCGQKWQAVKMSGQAGSDTWREFATKCLTERAAGTQASP